MVREAQAHRWREEYADFVTAYNETLTTESLPLDEWKTL
ncbi:MAG: type II toxin-antitoxin system CcdA family antitoxin [Betaproteobacteria bacterium]|nr:type II toxin-antitoxin system CcdA family antitoxin [Betaproteobacteria bacterium]MCL2160580.1 type II toxin-antitoxin system CcdA family antitoxin [Betaproteobacteria bacterium]